MPLLLMYSYYALIMYNISYPSLITTDCTQSANESSIGAEPDLGDIRLSNGCSGELEVYSNPLNIEGWYSVCAANSGFLERESQVVCKQLGCLVDGATQAYRYLWGAVCAKIKIHVAFIFPVGIYGINNGNLLKSSQTCRRFSKYPPKTL